MQEPQGTSPSHNTPTESTNPARRDFVDPQLRRHDSLPRVTTGFVGTFVP